MNFRIYQPPDEQEILLDAMESNDCTPSHSQSIRLKKASRDGCLTESVIYGILDEERGNQKEVLKLSSERYDKYLKRFPTTAQKEDYVERALKHYERYLDKKRSNEER